MAVFLKLLGLIFTLLTVIFVLIISSAIQFGVIENEKVIFLAIVLIIVAIAVSQIAIKTLGKFFDRLAIKTDHQLVTDGIYSFVRHPIYTSYILLFLGFCFALQSFWGLSLLSVVCLIWFGNRIGIMVEDCFSLPFFILDR